jgi:MFS family permease
MTMPALAVPAPDPRRWTALAILLAGAFLPPLDFFIVNVALPSIRQDLNASAASIQLVMSGYAVAYAVLLILGGRLGDLFGRRRVFLFGLAGFAAASALCGFAWSAHALVAGRIIQGIAAAVLAPQALASIHDLFPAHEKARALGLFGTALGSAAVLGQVFGGLLISWSPFGFGWRTVFLINLPVVALAIPAALFWLRESRLGGKRRLDLGGAALLALGLGALVVPLIEGREQGWPVWAFALFAAAPVLLFLFWRYEQRVAAAGHDPLVLPSVFAAHGLVRGLLATLTFYSMASFFLIFPLYQEVGLGRDVLHTGLAFLPFGAGFLAGSQLSPFAQRRFGALAATGGIMVTALSMMSLAYVVWAGIGWGVEPALLMIGLGQGTALPALVRAVIDLVDPHFAGLASGLVNATLQIGAALSVAVIGGLFFTVLGAGGGAASVDAGFSLALMGIAGTLLAGAWLISGLRRRA